MSEPISVQLDVVQGLAEELTGLAAELSADEALCGAVAGSFWAAVEGTPGYWASAAGTGWAGVLEVLAQRSAAVAATFAAACEEYRRAEAELARVLDALLGRGHR